MRRLSSSSNGGSPDRILVLHDPGLHGLQLLYLALQLLVLLQQLGVVGQGAAPVVVSLLWLLLLLLLVVVGQHAMLLQQLLLRFHQGLLEGLDLALLLLDEALGRGYCR